MKIIAFVILLAALIVGLAGASYAQPYGYPGCLNNNSKACRDARNAFAEHHNGLYPRQWYNQRYQSRQGRWNQYERDWRWEDVDGDDCWREHAGWEWTKHHHHHEDDDD